MTINELIDAIEVTLDDSPAVPMSHGKHLVDIDRVQAYLDEIRKLLPEELSQAQAIANDRVAILKQANQDADAITRKAESRAQAMIAETEIMRQAQKRVAEVMSNTKAEERALRQSVGEYCEDMLQNTEKVMGDYVTEVKTLRAKLNQSMKDFPRI